jgi:hypothetical protein
MKDPTEESLVTLEIRLRRFLTSDGRMAWQFLATPDSNSVDMLGLLQAGIFYVHNQMGRRDEF